MAKKKLSQSKNAILKRIYTRNKKLKEISNEIKKYTDRESKKKVPFEGKMRKQKTIFDIYISRAKEINNEISIFENQLKNYHRKTQTKFIKKSEKRNVKGFHTGGQRVWERSDFDNLLKRKRIKEIRQRGTKDEYLSKDKNYPDIQSLIDRTFLEMGKYDTIHMVEYMGTGKAEFYVIRHDIKPHVDQKALKIYNKYNKIYGKGN